MSISRMPPGCSVRALVTVNLPMTPAEGPGETVALLLTVTLPRTVPSPSRVWPEFSTRAPSVRAEVSRTAPAARSRVGELLIVPDPLSARVPLLMIVGP